MKVAPGSTVHIFSSAFPCSSQHLWPFAFLPPKNSCEPDNVRGFGSQMFCARLYDKHVLGVLRQFCHTSSFPDAATCYNILPHTSHISQHVALKFRCSMAKDFEIHPRNMSITPCHDHIAAPPAGWHWRLPPWSVLVMASKMPEVMGAKWRSRKIKGIYEYDTTHRIHVW